MVVSPMTDMVFTFHSGILNIWISMVYAACVLMSGAKRTDRCFSRKQGSDALAAAYLKSGNPTWKTLGQSRIPLYWPSVGEILLVTANGAETACRTWKQSCAHYSYLDGAPNFQKYDRWKPLKRYPRGAFCGQATVLVRLTRSFIGLSSLLLVAVGCGSQNYYVSDQWMSLSKYLCWCVLLQYRTVHGELSWINVIALSDFVCA